MSREEGSSLIELVVAMALLSLFSALFLVAVGQLNPIVRKQQDVADAAEVTRGAFARLDAQVRSADAVNDPGPGPTGTAQYVEYRWRSSKTDGLTVRCSQWQVEPDTGVLRVREWPEGAGSPATAPWSTVTSAVVGAATRPVFVTPGTWQPTPADPGPHTPATQLQAQQLSIALTVGSGNGQAAVQATLVAGSSTTGSAPVPAVCGGAAGRTP